MKPMLFDTLESFRIAARCTFATQPPAYLVERDLLVVLPVRAIRKPIGGGQAAHAPAQNHDFFACHPPYFPLRCLTNSSATSFASFS